MIRAKKNRAFEGAFTVYTKQMLRKHFAHVLVSGIGNVGGLDRSLPIIGYGNHSSWWDGLLEFFLSKRAFHLDPFMMMDERQMVRYSFFRRIGAFSVNRVNAREAAESVRYAASLLTVPGRVLWIYPQGDMRPNDSRPLKFYNGIARIASMVAKVQCLPIAHRYEFINDQRPDAFVSVGKPIVVEIDRNHMQLTQDLEATLTVLLDELRCTIARGDHALFSEILTGRRSTNELYDRVRGRKVRV